MLLLYCQRRLSSVASRQVPRRVKVLAPDSRFFSVQRIVPEGKEDGSTVASGIEVAFTVTFRPESTENSGCDLVVCTEREKFIIPIVDRGAIM